jgi:hypothetical protein
MRLLDFQTRKKRYENQKILHHLPRTKAAHACQRARHVDLHEVRHGPRIPARRGAGEAASCAVSQGLTLSRRPAPSGATVFGSTTGGGDSMENNTCIHKRLALWCVAWLGMCVNERGGCDGL